LAAFGDLRSILSLSLLLLLFLSGLPAQAQSAAFLRSDFDSDGAVDLEDFELFRAAFGTDNETYDLDGDGIVSLADSFIFADDFGKVVEVETPPILPLTVSANDLRTVVLTDSLRMIIQNVKPFGISSLRLSGQQIDYAHPDLPLADWEWLWFQRQGFRLATKLIEETFERPTVERFPEQLVITYRKNGLSYRPVDVEIIFRVPLKGSYFEVEYVIRNGAIHTLEAPYAMLGFPGFSNYALVNEVSLSGKTRDARKPYGNFRSEGLARNEEYALLRQDLPGRSISAMTSSVAIDLPDRTCRLETTFLPPGDLTALFSAHTNKPNYMTSHLYVTMPDLEVGQSRSLSVHYDLSETMKTETD